MLRKRMLRLALGVAGLLAAAMPALAADSPVADAAMRGDHAAVRELLAGGADVNAPQGDGMTALHWAARHGDAALAEMLLYAGANHRATTRLGDYTPLVMAGRTGNAELIQILLNAGADPNTPNSLGITPLMTAAMSGNAEAVRVLLDGGADVNAAESVHGQTALVFAAAMNRVEVLKTLTAHGADLNLATRVRMPGERPLGGNAPPTRTAAGQQQAAPARQQQPAGNAGATAGATGGNATAAAAARRDPDEEEESDGDPLGGLTPLHYAVREGQLEAVRALLDAGADVNSRSGDDTTPLLMAAINGRFDIAMFLLERGADPNIASTAGATPLFAALNSQWAPHAFYPQPHSPSQEQVTHIALMQALIAHGANPNARVKKKLWYTYFNAAGQSGISEEGATAFWRAAQASDIEAMKLLIAAGADPTIPNADGVTPLNVAAGNGWRGNLNVNSPAGWMPAVRYLVDELGVDVNQADQEGYSPLHAAAERGDNAMILFLVSNGANVKAETRRGQTVADMANGPRQRIQPFPETVQLLVALGARNSNKCVSC